jgi:hypothetical protein
VTAPVRIDLASLSPEDLARLREMLRTRPGQRSPETQAAITMQHRLIVEVALKFYMGSRNHRAECVHRDLGRYQATAWQRYRAHPECHHTRSAPSTVLANSQDP